MSENSDREQNTPIVGRTIWDVIIASSYIMAGLLFVGGLALILYFALDELPTWFWISIAGSFAFIPFLLDRAKDGSDLILVSDDEFKLTEYRVGRKYGLEIEGNGVNFTSKSGVNRLLLTDIDIDNKYAKGSLFGGYSQIDQVRDINTLTNLSELLEDNLRETRISAQNVGVEVEKQSKQIVDWALKLVYGSIIPNEISDIFGIDTNEEFEHQTVEELVEAVTNE